VKYVYLIEGEPTTVNENPKVELNLPDLVKVTARPIKPTCNDCGASPSMRRPVSVKPFLSFFFP
jgi:hypothetical protein